MAGFAYNLTENAALELGYRYVNFGQITGYNGMTGTTFTKNLSAQEIRVGLRYLVD
jgi:opacity protein-like surface antigen